MFRTIISLVGITAAGALFFLYTKPAYDSVKVLQAQIGEYDQALEKAAELQRLKQTLLSRYNAFNPTDIDRLHKMLPDHVDNVRLVLDLDSLAARRGISLQNVTISNAANSNVDQTVVSAIGAGNQKYGSLTLEFSTQGSYETFVAFLKDLESSLRLVDINSLTIDQAGSTGNGPQQYRFDISMKTYWLK